VKNFVDDALVEMLWQDLDDLHADRKRESVLLVMYSNQLLEHKSRREL
jgi:hypothetical protein